MNNLVKEMWAVRYNGPPNTDLVDAQNSLVATFYPPQRGKGGDPLEGIKIAEERALLAAQAPALFNALRQLVAATNVSGIQDHHSKCRCTTHEAIAVLETARPGRGRQK